ncbi:MAG: hypothetical protein HYY18_17870 [Planctomycetes bacterium]|nr:hypothetical protein [Planctomycetota bacterium]
MRLRRSVMLGVLATLAAGCSAGKTVVIEAKGSSVYLKGASAESARRVMEAANARIEQVDVAGIVSGARGNLSSPAGRVDVARGKGNFASKDPLAQGAVLSFSSRGQSEDAPAASLPAGKDLRGQLHMKVLAWPHGEGAMAHPNLLLPQAEVDAVMDRSLTDEGIAFAKRIVEGALQRETEILIEEAKKAGFTPELFK